MRQLIVGSLVRSLPVGEPQVLARDVSMPDACATSVGTRDTGAPVLDRTILRGSALASNVGASMRPLPFDQWRVSEPLQGPRETASCVSSSIRRETLSGIRTGPLTANQTKHEIWSSVQRAVWRLATAGSRIRTVRISIKSGRFAGSGSWRREWDSDSGASSRFCKLQIPRCQGCRRCHRCRGALPAIARAIESRWPWRQWVDNWLLLFWIVGRRGHWERQFPVCSSQRRRRGERSRTRLPRSRNERPMPVSWVLRASAPTDGSWPSRRVPACCCQRPGPEAGSTSLT
jgi:hypothetical protein